MAVGAAATTGGGLPNASAACWGLDTAAGGGTEKDAAVAPVVLGGGTPNASAACCGLDTVAAGLVGSPVGVGTEGMVGFAFGGLANASAAASAFAVAGW